MPVPQPSLIAVDRPSRLRLGRGGCGGRKWLVCGFEMVSQWYSDAMKVTMDRAGRIVLPKQLREQLDLHEGDAFSVVVEGWTVRLEPAARPARRVVEVDGWPVLEAVPDAALTDDDVRRLREADRR